MHEWQNKEAGEAFQYLLDTFSGANTDFADFMFMIREMDNRAAKGDTAAAQVVQIMIRFARLVGSVSRKR